VPYIVVTNLARTMRELKDKNIWLVGADDSAKESLYKARSTAPWRSYSAPRARACAASRRKPATTWCRSR
jgi:hypothetical protein